MGNMNYNKLLLIGDPRSGVGLLETVETDPNMPNGTSEP